MLSLVRFHYATSDHAYYVASISSNLSILFLFIFLNFVHVRDLHYLPSIKILSFPFLRFSQSESSSIKSNPLSILMKSLTSFSIDLGNLIVVNIDGDQTLVRNVWPCAPEIFPLGYSFIRCYWNFYLCPI